MQCNVGKKDKAIRIGAGVIIILLGLLTKNWLSLIGIIPIATGILRWCPAYTLLKINTNSDTK